MAEFMDIDPQFYPVSPNSKDEQVNKPKQSLTCKPKIIYSPEAANTITDPQPKDQLSSNLQQTNSPTQTLDCSPDINYNPKAFNTMTTK